MRLGIATAAAIDAVLHADKEVSYVQNNTRQLRHLVRGLDALQLPKVVTAVMQSTAGLPCAATHGLRLFPSRLGNQSSNKCWEATEDDREDTGVDALSYHVIAAPMTCSTTPIRLSWLNKTLGWAA